MEAGESLHSPYYWLYSPGYGAEKWGEFSDKGIMAIARDYLGDLSQYASREEMQEQMKERRADKYATTYKNASLEAWEFAHEMQVGDVVIAKKGTHTVCGWGIVQSKYYYDASQIDEYKNIRKVKWCQISQSGIDFWQSLETKLLTNITPYKDLIFALSNLFNPPICDSVIESYGDAAEAEPVRQFTDYRNPYSTALIASKNLIFHGAPGTGKTYLAKEIAADIVSEGQTDNYKQLSDEQKKQIGFVQFHPSYDYSDFVEGLRPKTNADGSMGFELQDGIFKEFVERARTNFEDAQKPREAIEKEVSVQESMSEFFAGIEFGADTFKTITGNEFTITSVDDRHINIFIPGNATVNKLALNLYEIRRMLESGQKFSKIKDVTAFFGKVFATQAYSYDFAIYNEIKSQKRTTSKAAVKQESLKKYVFIIDEINRGEISKIFGELLFAIDPGYRGKTGEISTQYANLHLDTDKKFYIPENVYIIGTMNDIDRSVDSFDFAMRRRFRFIELRSDACVGMLAGLDNEELKTEAIRRMAALNKEIAKVEGLNESYQIGAAYFLRLKTVNFDQLWTDCLQPLLQEYVRGMYHEKECMRSFAKAYGYREPAEDSTNETA